LRSSLQLQLVTDLLSRRRAQPSRGHRNLLRLALQKVFTLEEARTLKFSGEC
jgi:hypothetical protein